jgi:hypothetical protein
MAALTTCRRRRADGSICANLTDYADGWCRQDGCTGFRAAIADNPPPTDEPGHEDARTTAQSANVAAIPWRPVAELDLPLDSDEAYDVSVTRTARENFIGIHGGTHSAAEAEIRALVEDALHHGKARALPNGRWQVAIEGYKATITSNGAAVVRYATVHRERSYAQVRAGVPSRISAKNKLPAGYRRDERQEAPREPRAPLSVEALRGIDPSALRLSARAIRELARQGLAGDDDPSTRALIAPILIADLADGEITAFEYAFLVDGATVRWKFSLDGRILVSAARRRQTEQEPTGSDD